MVVHGYTLDEVTDFIAQKSSTNITTNHSYAVLTTYVNERHGFLGLAKHNQSSKIYGFYPTDEVVGFDYVSASIIWCTAFNALTIATILLVSTLYQVGSTFGAAAPIISTAAIAYDLSRGKDSYIDKSLTYSHILDIASSATQKSLSFYNKLNDAIGVLPSTATIFCVGLLSTTAFAKYMYGNKLAYSNLALHASTATTTIFSKILV